MDCPNGMPNTFLFQIRPLPRTYAQCPKGMDCCSPWKAQTAHAAMNVALADGSVHTVSPGVSQQTWNYLMQPRDEHQITEEW